MAASSERAPPQPRLQRGLLLRHSGGCLSPRVLDFLCFDTPRSVLGGEEGEAELPFYLAAPDSLEQLVAQGSLPCPALWADSLALAAGSGALCVLFRLGGALQHCQLPGKPIRLQPIKQGSSGSASSGCIAGGGKRGAAAAGTQQQPLLPPAAARAYVSARRHTQLYRLVVGLFTKLEQLHQELTCSGTVELRCPTAGARGGSWAPPGPQSVWATPMPQGVLLERLTGDGEAQRLAIAIDFAHACLVLRPGASSLSSAAPGAGPGDCLRSVNCLAEALAVLHHETGRLGPSLTASPSKQPGSGGAAPGSPAVFQSPAKPPLPASHGVDALRLAVGLVQACSSGQLREGLAILSAAAGSPQASASAVALGALEALITAAATVLPSASMGPAELQPSLAVAVTSLLDAAPPASYAAGRVASILAAVLQQSCANPLLLCQLLVALLQRADVQAEAMRQGLAGPIADMYARLSPEAAAAAAELLGAGSSSGGAAVATASPARQQHDQQGCRDQPALAPLGFGSPLLAGQAENAAAAGNSKGQVAALVATFNAMSDSGSDCSPSASRSSSPVKGLHARSPSAASSGRFSVPRLALPTPDSPTAAIGGLTRSTRRVLSGTPGGGARSPSPFASPTRRSGTCDSAEPRALAELATLASALGESLTAADLPAIVAHKRRADIRLSEEDGVPAELLEPPPGTAKKVLEAHRILVTARSLRSVDSSATRTTGTEQGPADGAGGARAVQDVEKTKCLLLRALVAALPVLDQPSGWPAVDPSPLLAAEVTGLLGKQLSAEQEQLKSLAVQALLWLSQRPVGAAQSSSSSSSSTASSTSAHVLIAAVGQRLNALANGGRPESEGRKELLAALQLLTDYVNAAAQPSVAAALVRHCLPGLQALLGVLQVSGLDAASWSTATWQLLHAVVLLAATACRKCEDAEAGRGLLSLLLADQHAAALLASAGSHMLLQPEQAHGGTMAQRSRAAALQRDLLQLFAALAGLAGRQPPCVQGPHHPRDSEGRAASRISVASSGVDGAGTSRGAPPGPGQDLLLGLSAHRGLTRRHALQFFSFLVSPHSGLVQRILDHEPSSSSGGGRVAEGARGRARPAQPPAPAGPSLCGPSTPACTAHMRLRQGLLELLRAVFSAPGSPFAADKFVSDFYVRFHFVQFLKLYHNPQRDHQALFLCRQHMDILLVLAANKSPHIRHRFHQLSVLDFFVRELSLEFEAKQPARGRMHRLSSNGSQLEHRRTSSGSTFGGLESGIASPTMSLRLPTVHEPEALASPGAAVPLLRLPSRGSGGFGAAVAEAAGVASSPVLQLPPGIGGRGAVPRLNLGGAVPSLPSPGGQSTPSPGNSARHGRPPLPPSARSGKGATPRLTSRLGRTLSARSTDPALAAALAAAPHQQQHQQHQQHQTSQQQPPALAPAAGGLAKPGIPKLGLAGVGRSLSSGVGRAEQAPAAAVAASAVPAVRPPCPEGRAPSRVHFSPTPSRLAASDGESDTDSDSSSDDGGSPPVGGSAGMASGAASMRLTPLGLDVPAGFTFTGDLEEDLDRLEALEEVSDGTLNADAGGSDVDSEFCHTDGETESPTASPTIPALRTTPFHQGAAPVPPLLPQPIGKSSLPALAQLALRLPVEQRQDGAGGSGRGLAVPIPRLDLSQSAHSTLETRNASAEMQLAVDAEQAKARQGRGVLGELERSALGKGKVQAATVMRKLNSALSDLSLAAAAEVSYSEERGRRLLYRDEGLHLEVLQLVFTLILTEAGELDRTYCDQYPWERKLQNIPFVLYHHLNHEDNRPLLPHLLPRLAGPGAGAPALRLLRVLCSAFFRPEWYCGRARISSAVGAFSTVYRASLPHWAGEGTVVLKLVDTPRHIQDRCAQVDVQGEVSILEALSGCRQACQLYDYGVDPAADAMFLVLKDYRCSLRQWRSRQPASPAGQLRLYYAVFAEVVSAVGALLERGVVHFDLKCDNCLLEPLPGVSEAEFWAPSSERPPFRVVLADFGESKVFSDGTEGALTARARGTDCFKSPEMLTVGAGAAHKEQRYYDRRRVQGVGPASDVWSLGCLLYELVAGKLLFSDTDWLQLVARVTSPTMPLVTEDRAAPVAGLPGMLDLLHFMLVRDARMRPTLEDVQTRLAAIRSSSRVRLPPHMRGTAAPLSSRGAGSGLHHSLSQMLSPTSYAPSPKATMPVPLLAALPLSPQLVLAPLALLSSAAALKQHPARRVLLLFSPASLCPAGGAAAGMAGGSGGAAAGLSPVSKGSAASSSLDSSPVGSRGYGGPAAAPAITFAPNPIFSPGGSLSAAASSPIRGGRTSGGRSLTGTPRMALRFATTAVHPEPSADSSWPAVPSPASAGSSPTRPLLGSNRVHPECGPVGGEGDSSERQTTAPGVRLPVAPLPLTAALGSARSLGSSRAGSEQAALLQRVLSDPELSAATASCNAAGVECSLAQVRAAGAERGMQQPLALAQWLEQAALPLLNGGASARCITSSGGPGSHPSGLPVLLAVQAGCEAEGAMVAVAHFMQQQRQPSLYRAMVAASQWGIDLHLRQHHLLALQHWSASAEGPTLAPASARHGSGGGGSARSAA
ncbi:hypothetical protein ABPG75_013854 [Micractinium tetrahymenae]